MRGIREEGPESPTQCKWDIEDTQEIMILNVSYQMSLILAYAKE